MDSVIEKLSEIEETAEAIVAHANEEKAQIEKELQQKRDDFDKELEEKTVSQVAQIREEGERKMNEVLEEQRVKNQSIIQGLEQEYEEHHAEYAEDILRRITEV